MLTSTQKGVTLIELMIGLAIVAFLLMLGVPAFSTFMGNQRVRAAAESVSTGLQLARAEAVHRNGRVDFVLTDDDPIAAGVSSLTPSTTGRNWVVRYYNPTTMFFEFVEGHDGATGSGSYDATPIRVTATDATLSFNGFGATTLGATATFRITNPVAGDCAAAGGTVRCLNVVVSTAGQVRMCDPKVSTTDLKDTRRC